MPDIQDDSGESAIGSSEDERDYEMTTQSIGSGTLIDNDDAPFEDSEDEDSEGDDIPLPESEEEFGLDQSYTSTSDVRVATQLRMSSTVSRYPYFPERANNGSDDSTPSGDHDIVNLPTTSSHSELNVLERMSYALRPELLFLFLAPSVDFPLPYSLRDAAYRTPGDVGFLYFSIYPIYLEMSQNLVSRSLSRKQGATITATAVIHPLGMV
ncbi:hypothetical protein FA15DRAFT_703333 [Coprinopsis marcescibilis]|uniref:Uncharacterized protein n=1 Tax=Coprinopsis marcescibilis TaxID=230819 RepID=A0A5C3KZP2_COPMA|nr:hypothetical protein FA15DRAFT_703333 [Coprinopsis marcescibilis]